MTPPYHSHALNALIKDILSLTMKDSNDRLYYRGPNDFTWRRLDGPNQAAAYATLNRYIDHIKKEIQYASASNRQI